MSFIAPLFSARARERRASLAAARKAQPGSVVELVLPHPLSEVAPGEFRQPDLLVASGEGVSIQTMDGSETLRAPWSDIAPITVELLPEPVAVIADRRYFGVHGSGTFALSPQQLRRMVKRVESRRSS